MLAVAQSLFMNDAVILDLLGLTDATMLERAKHIIKRSRWNDLAGSEKRLCIYFRPSRMIPNQLVMEEVLQIDCHVPVVQDYIAYRVQKRVREILHGFNYNGRTFYFDGMLGELPTMQDFFCVGSRYVYYGVI